MTKHYFLCTGVDQDKHSLTESNFEKCVTNLVKMKYRLHFVFSQECFENALFFFRDSKSEVALLQTLSRLFHVVQFVKWWQFFSGVEFEKTVSKSRKRKRSRGLVFTFSTKRKSRYFHVVLLQGRQRNVQKSVMHVQSCCFGNLNQSLFWPLSLTSPSSLLKVARVGFLWSIPPQFECHYVNKDIEKKGYLSCTV